MEDYDDGGWAGSNYPYVQMGSEPDEGAWVESNSFEAVPDSADSDSEDIAEGENG